jgi:hypothetical protein
MTLAAAFTLAASTLAGLTGPWAYTQWGVLGLGPLAALCVALSIALVLGFVREQGGGSS